MVPLDLPHKQTLSKQVLTLIGICGAVNHSKVHISELQAVDVAIQASRGNEQNQRLPGCTSSPSECGQLLTSDNSCSLFLDIMGVEISCSELCLSLCCQCLQINEVNPVPFVSEIVKEWSNQPCIHEVIIKWLMEHGLISLAPWRFRNLRFYPGHFISSLSNAHVKRKLKLPGSTT